MIVSRKVPLPEPWSDADLRELIDHAIDLGHNGNPAGYFLQVDLGPYVARDTADGKHILLPYEKWDYPGIRLWMQDEENLTQVKRVWGFGVRPDYW